MSYCRMSDDSDVYIIGYGDGVECCGCTMDPKRSFYGSNSEMIAHLREHKRTGDKVPKHAIERLLREIHEGSAK